MKPINPIDCTRSTQNDLFNRAVQSSNKTQVPSKAGGTESAIVSLSGHKLPSFLYNASGKYT